MNDQQLWKAWKAGITCEGFTIQDDREKLKVRRNQCYLFTHDGIQNIPKEKRTSDMYWKGQVKDITRAQGKTKPPLLLVGWFYSQEHVREEFENDGISSETEIVLNSMAPQELCYSTLESIVEGSSIECDIDIQVLSMNGQGSLSPVCDYFVRYSWEPTTRMFKAEAVSHCANGDCDRLWSPGNEEQRYCWGCDFWFHSTCVENRRIKQEEYMSMMVGKYLLSPDTSEIPPSILEVALQPTARGGSVHFAAGNLRIVKFARGLLDSTAWDEAINNHNWFAAHLQEVTDGDQSDHVITDEDWRRFMEDEHGMKEEERGEPRFEQLVVDGQTIFTCSICNEAI